MDVPRLLFAATVCVGGCVTSVGDGADGEISQDVVVPNGVSLNGVSLNGVSLNGVSLSGVSLNGVSLHGVSAGGTAITIAASATVQPLTGTTSVGSKWTAALSNGASLPLRIDSAIAGTGTNSDVWMYGVSYQTGSTWTPLCGLDTTNAPILADTVPGVWNTQAGVVGGGAYSTSTTQFTFACRAKTIAKCVELGYKPWKGYSNLLQSCVRLLRADICGDGTPHTLDGQTLNLYDALGIQTDTEAWVPEAEWNTLGATCMAKKGEQRFQYLNLPVPQCASLKETSDCGTQFHLGSLLIDELPLTVQPPTK
jgi:ADYC domain/Pentapeptide repeats (8 copies)